MFSYVGLEKKGRVVFIFVGKKEKEMKNTQKKGGEVGEEMILGMQGLRMQELK